MKQFFNPKSLVTEVYGMWKDGVFSPPEKLFLSLLAFFFLAAFSYLVYLINQF